MKRRALLKGLVAAAATRCLPRRHEPKRLPPQGGFEAVPEKPWTWLIYGWGIEEARYITTRVVRG